MLRPVKLRLLLAVVLLLVGVGLPAAAIAMNGVPWAFRGHAAIVMENTGNVEMTASDVRREREGRADDALSVGPNLRLDVGDTIRVARLSETWLRLPAGDVVLKDGATATLTKDGLRLQRGLVEVRVKAGPHKIAVELESSPLGTITLSPGAEAGLARVLADGKVAVQVWVGAGSAGVRTSEGEIVVEPGMVATVGPDKKPTAAVQNGFSPSAVCHKGTLTVTGAPPATQVFALGRIVYPEVAGEAVVDKVAVDVTTIKVFARDVAGNVARLGDVACTR